MSDFDWLDFAALAVKLQAAKDEASWRSAISRAYYAAFHVARQYVERKKPGFRFPRDGSAHDMVWRELQHGIRQEMAASFAGKELKRKRGLADYRLDQLKFPHDVSYALQRAQTVCRSLGAGWPQQ